MATPSNPLAEMLAQKVKAKEEREAKARAEAQQHSLRESDSAKDKDKDKEKEKEKDNEKEKPSNGAALAAPASVPAPVTATTSVPSPAPLSPPASTSPPHSSSAKPVATNAAGTTAAAIIVSADEEVSLVLGSKNNGASGNSARPAKSPPRAGQSSARSAPGEQKNQIDDILTAMSSDAAASALPDPLIPTLSPLSPPKSPAHLPVSPGSAAASVGAAAAVASSSLGDATALESLSDLTPYSYPAAAEPEPEDESNQLIDFGTGQNADGEPPPEGHNAAGELADEQSAGDQQPPDEHHSEDAPHLEEQIEGDGQPPTADNAEHALLLNAAPPGGDDDHPLAALPIARDGKSGVASGSESGELFRANYFLDLEGAAGSETDDGRIERREHVSDLSKLINEKDALLGAPGSAAAAASASVFAAVPASAPVLGGGSSPTNDMQQLPVEYYPRSFNGNAVIRRRSVRPDEQHAELTLVPEPVMPVPFVNIQPQSFPITLIAQLLGLHACIKQTELGKRIASKSGSKFIPSTDEVINQCANELVEYAIFLFITIPPAPNALIALAEKIGEMRYKLQSLGYGKDNEFLQGLAVLSSANPGAHLSTVKNIFNCDYFASGLGNRQYARQLQLIDVYLIEKFYNIFYKYACAALERSDKPSSIVQNTFRYILRDILKLALLANEEDGVRFTAELNKLNARYGNNSATVLDLLLNIIRQHTVKVGVLPAFYHKGEIGDALKEVLGFFQRIYPSNIQPLTLNELLVKRPILVSSSAARETPTTQLEILRTNILRITDACCDNTLGREVIDDLEGKIKYIKPDDNEILILRKLAGYAVHTSFDKRSQADILAELHKKMLEVVKELRPTSIFGTKKSTLSNTLAKLAGVNAGNLLNDPKYADAYKFDPENLLPLGIVLDTFSAEESAHYLRLHIIQYAGHLAAEYKAIVNQSSSDNVIKEKYLKRIENQLEALYRMTPIEIHTELEKLKGVRLSAVDQILNKYKAVLQYLRELNPDVQGFQAAIQRLSAESEKIIKYKQDLARQDIDIRYLVLHKLLGDMHPRFDINNGLRHHAFGNFIIYLETYLYGHSNVDLSLVGKLPALDPEESPQTGERPTISLFGGSGHLLGKIEKMAKTISVINWFCNTELGRQIAEQSGIAPNLNCSPAIHGALMTLANAVVKAYLNNHQNFQLKEEIKKAMKTILKVAYLPAERSLVCTLLLLADVDNRDKSAVKLCLSDISDKDLTILQHQPLLPDKAVNNIDTQTPIVCEELIVRHIIGQIDQYLSVFNIEQFGKPTRLQEYQVYRVQKNIAKLQKPAIGDQQAVVYQGPQLTTNIFTWLRSLLPVAGILPELCQKAALAELLNEIYLLSVPTAVVNRSANDSDVELRLISRSSVVLNPQGTVITELNKKFDIMANLLRVINYVLNTPDGKNIAREARCATNDDFRWNDRLKRLMMVAIKMFLTPPAENTEAQHRLINESIIKEIDRIAEEIHDAKGGKNAPVAHTLKAMVNHFSVNTGQGTWVRAGLAANIVQYGLEINYAQNYIEQCIIQGAITAVSVFDNDKHSNITELHRKGIREIVKEWNRFFHMSLADRRQLMSTIKGDEKNIYGLLMQPILNLLVTPLMGRNSIFYEGSVKTALNAAYDYLELIKPNRPSINRPLVVKSIGESQRPSGSPPSSSASSSSNEERRTLGK